ESVAWVSERKDLLSGLFFVLSLAIYTSYVRHSFSWIRYGLLVLCFALGLMSKSMLVTFPWLLLLLDYWPLRRWPSVAYDTVGPRESSVADDGSVLSPTSSVTWRQLLPEKLPLVALAIVSCWLTVQAQSFALMSTSRYPFSSRLANALMAYCEYIEQFF